MAANDKQDGKSICLAITGASGFQYAEKLLSALLHQECQVHLLVSDAAREVARLESDILLPDTAEELCAYFLDKSKVEQRDLLTCYEKRDWLSPVASGSSNIDAMVICPCSTGTLASVANGQSNNLIERAATVFLKEYKRMIIVPRETPVSAIQLEHQLKLAQLGVRILPASPGFYHKPQSIDDLINFMVARILQHLDLPHDLVPQWGME